MPLGVHERRHGREDVVDSEVYRRRTWSVRPRPVLPGWRNAVDHGEEDGHEVGGRAFSRLDWMPRLDESALRKGKRAVLREDVTPRFGGGGQELRSSSRGRTQACGTTSCSRTHAPSCSFAGASGSSAGMGASGTARRPRACSSGSRTTIRNVSARRLTREQSKGTM